jgi:hypothetical protein
MYTHFNKTKTSIKDLILNLYRHQGMTISHVCLLQLQQVLKVVTISVPDTSDFGEQRWPVSTGTFQFLPEAPPVSPVFYDIPQNFRVPHK